MAVKLVRAYENNQQLSERQQKDINNARARAVRQAWKQEKEYVKEGKGTRDWDPKQQEDILRNGNVQGFEGHHMRSVSNGKNYEEKMAIAEDKNNIQFLEKTKENNEHLKAHDGCTKNRTNGYYDVEKGKIKSFGENAPKAPKAEKLSNPVAKQEKQKEASHTESYGIDMSKAETKSEHNRNKNIERGR